MTKKTIIKLIQIYRFIENYQRENGTSPARREFVKLGLLSTSQVNYYLEKMESMKMIQPRVKHRPRSIALLPLAEADESIQPFLK